MALAVAGFTRSATLEVLGLSELPQMRDVQRWGVLTIGTGLGNARFSRAA